MSTEHKQAHDVTVWLEGEFCKDKRSENSTSGSLKYTALKKSSYCNTSKVVKTHMKFLLQMHRLVTI